MPSSSPSLSDRYHPSSASALVNSKTRPIYVVDGFEISQSDRSRPEQIKKSSSSTLIDIDDRETPKSMITSKNINFKHGAIDIGKTESNKTNSYGNNNNNNSNDSRKKVANSESRNNVERRTSSSTSTLLKNEINSMVDLNGNKNFTSRIEQHHNQPVSSKDKFNSNFLEINRLLDRSSINNNGNVRNNDNHHHKHQHHKKFDGEGGAPNGNGVNDRYTFKTERSESIQNNSNSSSVSGPNNQLFQKRQGFETYWSGMSYNDHHYPTITNSSSKRTKPMQSYSIYVDDDDDLDDDNHFDTRESFATNPYAENGKNPFQDLLDVWLGSNSNRFSAPGKQLVDEFARNDAFTSTTRRISNENIPKSEIIHSTAVRSENSNQNIFQTPNYRHSNHKEKTNSKGNRLINQSLSL